MEARVFCACVSAIVAMGFAGSAVGQAKKTSEVVAASIVAPQCLVTQSAELQDDGANLGLESGALALAGGALLAGVAGDVATAGINALGQAIEEASLERNFNAVGSASFAFYEVSVATRDGSGLVELKPALTRNASKCVILSYASDRAVKKRGRERVIDNAQQWSIDDDVAAAWKNYSLPAEPDLYVELVLQTRHDGFVVRPALIRYRRALPSAPAERALPAELHLTFSVPTSSNEVGAGTFAFGRLRLPPIAPGQVKAAADLAPYISYVLPLRPKDGTPTETKAAYATAFADFQSNLDEIARLERALERARKLAAAKGATKEEKASVYSLEDSLKAARDKTKQLKARRDSVAAKVDPVPAGSTNVEARFTLVRDANSFGLAIAESLKTRSKTLGESLTAHLSPATKADAWTANDTNYVSSLTLVDVAQRKIDKATAEGDADALFTAQIELRNARAAANAAAAASNRSLPFPGVL